MRQLLAARLAVVTAALVLSLEAGAIAQGDGGWVGRRVITKFGTVLKVGRAVVDDEKRQAMPRGGERRNARVYRVERASGPWLWLAAEEGGAAGWAKVEQVVPFEQAVDYYTAEIRSNPTASAYLNRGTVWHDRKEYDIAIADYNEAIRLDPGDEVAYYNRGNAWFAKKKYDRALADYNEAIRLDPKDTLAYNNRGTAWRAKKKYDRALADFNEAIRLDPKAALAYTNRAATYLVASREISLGEVRGWLDDAGWRGEYASYTVLYGHFALRRAHHDDDARRLLDEAATRGDTSVWPFPVIHYLRQEGDGKALIAAATDHDKMTGAQTFLGLDLIASGRAAEALPGLKWVRDHGNKLFIEHEIAVAEIDRIEATTTAARP